MQHWSEDTDEVLFSVSDPTNIYGDYGRANRFKVEVRGRNIVYYVNGVKLGEYKAPDEVRGFVGLYTNWPGMEVAFDNLRVTRLRVR